MKKSARLQDPKKVSGDDLELLQTKISNAMTKLALNPNKGGNPFFFALSASKYHYLTKRLPGMAKNDVWYTAATNGRHFFWHPAYLKRLTTNQIKIIIMHESIHIIYKHPNRCGSRNPRLWNYAVDYVTNNIIEKSINKNNYRYNVSSDWSGIGRPYPMAELKQDLDKSIDRFLENLNDSVKHAEETKDINSFFEKIKEEEDDYDNETYEVTDKDYENSVVYLDTSLDGKTAEEIYDEIISHIRKKVPEGSLASFLMKLEELMPDYAQTDEHIDIDLTEKEIIKQLLRAQQIARQMRGTIPQEIVDEIGELQEPTLSWTDLSRQSMRRAKEKNGNINDWSRFRRRALPLGLLLPEKIKYTGKFLVLLDTSGSMSEDDLIYGISQLGCIDGNAKGWVVPVDAAPHWNAAVEVKEASDLCKIKIVGRGGTVFDEFFRDYKVQMKGKGPFDLIIVITDGGFGHIPKELKPDCDVVFVATNNYEIDPPFGYVAPLRDAKLYNQEY